METKSEFHLRNAKEWETTIKEIFPIAVPERSLWVDISDIITILNHLCKRDNLTHMMYPNNGGMDLNGVKVSDEENCIEIDMQGIATILNPKKLMFESFHSSAEWFYFRLETNILDSTGVYENVNFYEDLLDINGQYYDSSHFDSGFLNDEPLPKGSRRLSRCLKGSFVIFAKSSTYNRTSDTYDGRHNLVDADNFRMQIQSWINKKK